MRALSPNPLERLCSWSLRPFWIAGFLFLAAPPGSRAELAANKLEHFMAQYCYECHDADERAGGIQLNDPQIFRLGPESEKLWEQVIDAVEFGEMPPSKASQPEESDALAFVEIARQGLLHATSTRRASEGRTPLRRLTREEYEYSVSDLLGFQFDFSKYLPDEMETHGFTNVSEGLGISAEQMQGYLQAATFAAHLLFDPEQPESVDLEEEIENLRLDISIEDSFRLRRLHGAVVLLAPERKGIGIRRFFGGAPVQGEYEVKLEARPVNSDSQIVSITMGGEPVYREVTPNQTQITVRQHLSQGDRIGLQGPTLPDLGKPDLAPLSDAAAAELPGLVLGRLSIRGPLYEEWPTPEVQAMLGDVDPTTAGPGDLAGPLERLAARAWRRPVTGAEVEPMVNLGENLMQEGGSYREALKAGVAAILCSRDFIFLTESPGPLDSYALASRLSTFFWKSIPDETLRAKAERGKLEDPQQLVAEVERLLNSPKANRFLDDFATQWLDLDEIDATTPDDRLYPAFNDILKQSLVAESKAFWAHLVRENAPAREIVHSDYAIVNDRLATHYDLPDVEGFNLRKVSLEGYQRGGVITQGSVMKTTANGTNTSPVLRGVWFLENILSEEPSPPPPNVPVIEPDIRGAKTIREQLAAHRANPACSSCHQKIDPYGFAFEVYDVTGAYRENYRTPYKDGEGEVVYYTDDEGRKRRRSYRIGPEVVEGDALPDGQRFEDIAGFKQALLEDEARIARGLAKKLVTYATGAPVEMHDRAQIDQMLELSASREYGVRTLIHAVTQSELFKTK